LQHQIFCSAPPLQTQPAGLPWPSARLPCMHTSGRWPPCQPAVSSVDRLVRQKGRLLLLLLKAAEERGEEEDPFCRNSSSSSCLQLHGVGKASQSVSRTFTLPRHLRSSKIGAERDGPRQTGSPLPAALALLLSWLLLLQQLPSSSPPPRGCLS
jgi:hypothetical protein